MLPPEPRLLKYLKMDAQSHAQNAVQLSMAAQALIIYSLVAGPELEAQTTGNACTALAVRRVHGIFSIRSMGGKRAER